MSMYVYVCLCVCVCVCVCVSVCVCLCVCVSVCGVLTVFTISGGQWLSLLWSISETRGILRETRQLEGYSDQLLWDCMYHSLALVTGRLH